MSVPQGNPASPQNSATPVPPGAPQSAPKPQADPKAQGVQPGASSEGQKPGEEKKDKELDPRFAALARKERALVTQQSQVKAQLVQVQERESKVAAAEARIREEIGKAQSDPLAALKLLGWTYEDLTNYVLNGKKAGPERQLKDLETKFDEKLNKTLEERERKRQEEQQAQAAREEQEAIEDFKGSISEFLSQHTAEYELIALEDPQDMRDMIFDTVSEHFERTKKILSVKEATDLVEQFLTERVEKAATQTKKLSGKFGAKPKDNQGEASDTQNPSGARTLTNHMSGSAAPSLLPAKTEQDRMARALARLSGE